MNLDEVKKQFLAGKCESIKDFVDEEDCNDLYQRYRNSLKGICKCRYKGVEKKYAAEFDKIIKRAP